MLDTHYIIYLPILFILHDTEEIITYHRWIIAHRKAFIQKFPRLRSMFNYMADFSTSSFYLGGIRFCLSCGDARNGSSIAIYFSVAKKLLADSNKCKNCVFHPVLLSPCTIFS